MILLSNGGTHIHNVAKPSTKMAVGTVDGVALLERGEKGWALKTRTLAGCSVSAVTALEDGTLFAATHGAGVARSRDEGATWDYPNQGLTQFDLWSARAGRLQGREVVLVGSQPAHLFVTEDGGDHWRELTAMRDVSSVSQWCFPPPPRIGHVKDIVVDGDRLFAGIEIGALLLSEDGGQSFRELAIDPDPKERDVHRILIDPRRPENILIANGLMGMMRTRDGGASWFSTPLPPDSNYPDAVAMHPRDPDLIFLTAGVGWPPHWYKSGRGRGKIARSHDGGATWERLLGGLPDGQRAVFSALTIEAWGDGYTVYAADTDGQIFETLDGGDRWSIIADVPAVSKGEFHRGLIKDRVPLATVDEVSVNPNAAARFARVS